MCLLRTVTLWLRECVSHVVAISDGVKLWFLAMAMPMFKRIVVVKNWIGVVKRSECKLIMGKSIHSTIHDSFIAV